MSNCLIREVLVVDDEEPYRRLVQQFVTAMGYNCRIAMDTTEALDKLGRDPVQLIVSDIRMPGRDGLELTREALKLHPELAIIIMTGHASDYTYSDIINAGAADFIAKPFEVDELKAKIERIERERRITSELHVANQNLAREAAVNSSIAQLSKALISPGSLDEISALVLDHAMRLSGSQTGFVGYIDRGTGGLVVPTLAGRVWDECEIQQKSRVFEKLAGLWGWVLEHREAVLTNDASTDPRSAGVPAGHLLIERFLAVPAIVDQGLVGILALANAQQPYSEQDLAVAEQLATIYALRVRRRWANEDLVRAKSYLENVFDNSAEAISIVDRRGVPIKWNKVATEMYGYTEDEMKRKPVFELYPDKDDLERMLTVLRQRGFVRRYEINMRKKDGRIAPFEISISLLKDQQNQTTGSVAVALDVSDLKKTMADLRAVNEILQKEIGERKQIEEQLRQAQSQLEQLVADRTAKLSRAGEIMKRSIDRFKSIAEE